MQESREGDNSGATAQRNIMYTCASCVFRRDTAVAPSHRAKPFFAKGTSADGAALPHESINSTQLACGKMSLAHPTAGR